MIILLGENFYYSDKGGCVASTLSNDLHFFFFSNAIKFFFIDLLIMIVWINKLAYAFLKMDFFISFK